ncbi:hypothetical protein Tco_0769335 [Tanacetum coccineum]|uniref:Uncharacterized protein n=1 Tax=Tanacetum coccineum TaxID=301880 RepID=A0ABQ4Z944_9ASTR
MMNSKKMQKYILKNSLKVSPVSNSERNSTRIERFQSLPQSASDSGAGIQFSVISTSTNEYQVDEYDPRRKGLEMAKLANDFHENIKFQKKMVEQELNIKTFHTQKLREATFLPQKRHFARECRTKEENRRRDGWNTGNREGRRTGNRDESITGKKEESKALVTVDGECVDWTTHSEDDDNYAFMANNGTGSDTQVPSCSNECKESYANMKRLYDIQKEQLSDASVWNKAYTQRF